MKKLFLLATVLMGCGGDGVSDSKKLTDLSAAETKDVCNELADDYPERTVNCSGTMITVGYSAADCAMPGDAAPDTCTATVGDVRDCADAIFSLSDEQICTSDALPAACAKLDGC
jgi:hypothetical protein